MLHFLQKLRHHYFFIKRPLDTHDLLIGFMTFPGQYDNITFPAHFKSMPYGFLPVLDHCILAIRAFDSFFYGGKNGIRVLGSGIITGEDGIISQPAAYFTHDGTWEYTIYP